MKRDYSDEAYRLRFYLGRGRKYYARFAARWEMLVLSEKLTALAMFAVSAYFIARPQPVSVAIVAPVIGFVGISLDLIFRADKRIAKNRDKSAAFARLQNSLPFNDSDATEKMIADIRSKRAEIEKDDIVFPCVSADCHNELAQEQYLRPDYSLSFVERTIGMVLPIAYRPKPLPHLVAQLNSNE